MIGKAVSVVALVLWLADGCKSGGGGDPGKKPVPPFNTASVESLCTVQSFTVIAMNPHQSKNTPTDMVGKARVTCSLAIDSLHIEVKIERLIDSDRWIDHTVVFRRDVAPVIGSETYTAQATAPCPKDRPEAKFRTAARAEGINKGSPAGMTVWKPSGEVKVACK